MRKKHFIVVTFANRFFSSKALLKLHPHLKVASDESASLRLGRCTNTQRKEN